MGCGVRCKKALCLSLSTRFRSLYPHGFCQPALTFVIAHLMTLHVAQIFLIDSRAFDLQTIEGATASALLHIEPLAYM